MGHAGKMTLLHWLVRQDTANVSLHVKQKRREETFSDLAVGKRQRNACAPAHPIEGVTFLSPPCHCQRSTAQPQHDGTDIHGEWDAAVQGLK